MENLFEQTTVTEQKYLEICDHFKKIYEDKEKIIHSQELYIESLRNDLEYRTKKMSDLVLVCKVLLTTL